MELLKVKILQPGLTHQGADVEVGTEIELPKRSALSLIEGKHAEAVEIVLNDKEGLDYKLPGVDAVNAAQTVVNDKATADKLQAKAIDAKFKADPLKDAAKNIGVEFKYDDNKPTVIAAIIAQGKAEAILALEVPAV